MKFQPKPTDHRFLDLTGERYGRLTVIGYLGKRQWYCKCDCGGDTKSFSSSLKQGKAQSCGCYHAHRASEANKKHGLTNSKEDYIFRQAKQRCTNPNDEHYELYGGRGIEFRLSSLEHLINEIGRKPTPSHTLDRINVNGHYEKGNIRWVTQKEQCRNKRTNINITYKGATRCVAEWAEILGINKSTLGARIKSGWCVECAFTKPFKQTCEHR